MKSHKPSLRRAVLASLALLALAAPALSSGCVGGFEPISKITGLRVLSVVADKPYAEPGDEVLLEMHYEDGLVNPDDPTAGPRPVQIVWLGGCFNPPGDQYYGCYDQLADLVGSLDPTAPQKSDFVGIGSLFSIKLPSDFITSRPKPPTGSRYGIAYVFFAACAGHLGQVPPDSSGRAGYFPIGCFDDDDNRLGPESFVPGYTQIYAFEDGRTNANPEVKRLTITGGDIEKDTTFLEGSGDAPEVEACPLSDEARSPAAGCGAKDPYTECEAYTIDVDVDQAIAEIDEGSTDPEGKKLREVVWVDYFADKGDLDADVRLVSDATTGLTESHEVRWIAPPEPGVVTFWAVVHDARGGAQVLKRFLRVK